MWVKIRFFKGPQPTEVVFENVRTIKTVEELGFSRLVITYLNEDTCFNEHYSTPTYLINKLEVQNDI